MAAPVYVSLFAISALAGEWTSLRVDPPRIALAGPGQSQRILITAVSSATGEERNLSDCSATPSSSGVVSVEPAGRIVAKAAGATRIRFSCQGLNAETEVRVLEASHDAAAMQVNFSRDLMSVFTTKGCNSTACHGSPAGQRGFKLSLYGSDPAADHRMIVEMHKGRRVDLANPEQSLLLRKPSLQIPHGGGQVMTPQSDEYGMLLRWLRQGARFDAGSNSARLTALEIYPRERILAMQGTPQPVVVIGRMSDGSTRDMTAEVRYTVNDEAVIAPPRNSAVAARGRGLTVLMARAFGKTATSQWIVVEHPYAANITTPAPANFIDEHIFAKLRQVNIQPFPVTSDRAFVRRVYLDAIGILPTPDETEAFVKDSDPGKRTRLIDQLLEREDYASHWLVKFEDWFRNSQYYSQGRTNGAYKRWLRDFIREDRPYDAAVREMITATGDTTVHPAGNFWHPAIDFMLKTFDVSKATPTVTRLFLGQRIECAECHNHPLENLTQDDFYGMAAFLGRMKVKHGYGQYRRIWYNTSDGEILHPVTKAAVQPRFLDGTVPEIKDDRREVLADWITRTQKVQFARATVNRVWAEYFGRGIVDPADDFRSTNMATHPELLDRLAAHFIDGGFRFKALHRLILNSKAYQLSAHTEDRPGGTDLLEKLLFARYEPRKLPAEVLLDSIMQVTAVPEEFRGYPKGTSSKELVASIGATYFLTTFGFPRRDVMLEHRPDSPSLGQALHLANSDAMRTKIESPQNILADLLQNPDDRSVIRELYLRAYSRPPADAQVRTIETYLSAETQAGRTRRRAFENVLWAILNSKEFQLNQ